MAKNRALCELHTNTSMYLNKKELFEATSGHWERVAAVTVLY